MDDAKATLVDYLQNAREALVWKVEGLEEYDARRPLTPTGTNLLGLVKHLAHVELAYFGDSFGRPTGIAAPWDGGDHDPEADLYLTPDETRDDVVGLYRTAWAHAAQTFATCDLDTVGHVSWWPGGQGVTLHRVLVHVVAETARHAGHADVLREGLDGHAGRFAWDTPDPTGDPSGARRAHVARVEQAARAAVGR